MQNLMPEPPPTLIPDDPAAALDIPAWCELRGQQFLGRHPSVRGPGYLVRRVS